MKSPALLRRTVEMLVLLGVVLWISHWPVTTRYGIDYQWSSKQIFLYEKIIHFLSRDIQTRRTAAEVTDGVFQDKDKLLEIFLWTGRNVRPTPEGFPVIDDHIQNIMTRGYEERLPMEC